MTQQNPGSYNWGVPTPAYGAGPPQPMPPQQPLNTQSAKRGLPTTLKVLLTLLAVLALAFAGLWIFQKLRPSPTGPLGWDETTLSSKLEAGKLTECELGTDFYDSVGIKDVEKDYEECIGTATSSDGAEFTVTLDASASPSGNGKAPKDAELTGWKESTDSSSVPDEVKDLANDSYGRGQQCTMSSSKPMLQKVELSTNGPCEALYPVARQLNNLQTQYDWERTSHGMFDFGSPEFLEVKAEPQSLVVPVFKQAKDEARGFGDTLEIKDPDYEGTTFTITDGNISSGSSPRVCAEGEVTLGRNTNEGAYRFNLPDTYVALFPNGQRLQLNAEDYPVRMQEGETKGGLRFCSSYTPEVMSKEFVVFVGSSPDDEYATWVVKDGGENEEA